MHRPIYLIALFLCCFLKSEAQTTNDQLSTQFANSQLFNQIFTGFALYDPAEESFIYQREADKYYTPASNIKILTLYSSLVALGDSIPAFYYQKTDSSFTFWGSGSPALLYDRLPVDSSVLQFLRSQNSPLQYATLPFPTPRFGPGWSWDDYIYAYQTERSSFPIYGNAVLFRHEKKTMNFEAIPSYFQNKVQLDPTLDNHRVRFVRAIERNAFTCNARALADDDYERYVPFRFSEDLLLQLLSDTINRPVTIMENDMQVTDIQAFYSATPADSIYQLMMQESDNFIAEQLLLTVSGKLLGVQDDKMAIDYLKDNYVDDLPDEPRWVDGSGLSRYNLMTPRSIVKLLEKIYRLLPEERLLNIFPTGGVSGTIEKWYAAEEGESPYVFAKTGTLSNKHCLSGYLKTKNGKILIFSFMNNNYIGSSTSVKREMEKVLIWIRNNY